MIIEKTERGFAIAVFSDRNGVECSIQKSSIATEDCIWFGCNEANPREFVPNQGWKPIPLPDQHIANTRMHLTRKQVRDLLPLLQKFVETGEL